MKEIGLCHEVSIGMNNGVLWTKELAQEIIKQINDGPRYVYSHGVALDHTKIDISKIVGYIRKGELSENNSLLIYFVVFDNTELGKSVKYWIERKEAGSEEEFPEVVTSILYANLSEDNTTVDMTEPVNFLGLAYYDKPGLL